MKFQTFLLSACLLLSTSVFAGVPAPLQVIDPWVREAPPGMQVMGAFLKLKNNSDQAVVVIGSHSDSFAKVEIHRTEITDGKARMLHQKEIEIQPGEEKVFEPGGFHLMMMKPVITLNEGAMVNIALELENGETIDFIAPVKKGMTRLPIMVTRKSTR